jgi:hypothetical protein
MQRWNKSQGNEIGRYRREIWKTVHARESVAVAMTLLLVGAGLVDALLTTVTTKTTVNDGVVSIEVPNLIDGNIDDDDDDDQKKDLGRKGGGDRTAQSHDLHLE